MLHSQTMCEWDLQVRAASSDEQCLRPFLRRPSRQRGNLTFELPARHQVTEGHTHMTSILDTFTSPPCSKFFPFVCFWEPPSPCPLWTSYVFATVNVTLHLSLGIQWCEGAERHKSSNAPPPSSARHSAFGQRTSNNLRRIQQQHRRRSRNQAAVSSREVEITLLVI